MRGQPQQLRLRRIRGTPPGHRTVYHRGRVESFESVEHVFDSRADHRQFSETLANRRRRAAEHVPGAAQQRSARRGTCSAALGGFPRPRRKPDARTDGPSAQLVRRHRDLCPSSLPSDPPAPEIAPPGVSSAGISRTMTDFDVGQLLPIAVESSGISGFVSG